MTISKIDIVNDYWFDSPMAIFEMVLSFWLLFKGLRPSNQTMHPTEIDTPYGNNA